MSSASRAPRGIWTGTTKRVTGIIGTLAAAMTFLLNAQSLGFSKWLGLVQPSVADHAARRIILSPRADTLRAIGDSLPLVASVTDARGAAVAGATLVWSSTDTAVATVDSTGIVVARAPGRTTVEARVREVVSTASLLVRQSPALIAIAGDTAVPMAEGDSMRLSAFVLDARGHRMSGPQLRWTSTDSAVAQVDSLGVLRARDAGRTTVVASSGELRSQVHVDIALAPAAIAIVSGAGQRALAGRALAEPIVLQVVARSGKLVPGITVALATEDGEGGIAPTSAVTDSRGRVRAVWTLGERAGEQRLVARVATLDSATGVVADADPTPRNTKVEVLSTDLRGTVAGPLESAVRIRVTDTLGVALTAVRVAWSALEGGSASGATATDGAGIAEARWTLGKRSGVQRLIAQVGNPRLIPAATLRAAAAAAAPRELTLVSGDAQGAVAGTRLAKPIVLQLRDSLGNAVIGATLRATPSSGSVEDSLAVTGTDGRVALRWTLGAKEGPQRLVVRLPGAALSVGVNATARPAPTVRIAPTKLPTKAPTKAPTRASTKAAPKSPARKPAP